MGELGSDGSPARASDGDDEDDPKLCSKEKRRRKRERRFQGKSWHWRDFFSILSLFLLIFEK
jgi:hypothetical protein